MFDRVLNTPLVATRYLKLLSQCLQAKKLKLHIAILQLKVSIIFCNIQWNICGVILNLRWVNFFVQFRLTVGLLKDVSFFPKKKIVRDTKSPSNGLRSIMKFFLKKVSRSNILSKRFNWKLNVSFNSL